MLAVLGVTAVSVPPSRRASRPARDLTRPLAERADNRRHDGDEKCSDPEKQQCIAQDRRHHLRLPLRTCAQLPWHGNRSLRRCYSAGTGELRAVRNPRDGTLVDHENWYFCVVQDVARGAAEDQLP
jgi:hypothetical protein